MRYFGHADGSSPPSFRLPFRDFRAVVSPIGGETPPRIDGASVTGPRIATEMARKSLKSFNGHRGLFHGLPRKVSVMTTTEWGATTESTTEGESEPWCFGGDARISALNPITYGSNTVLSPLTKYKDDTASSFSIRMALGGAVRVAALAASSKE